MADALPDSLDGRDRRDTTPSSARTAAWGEPAVVLRCGVARPARLRGGDAVVVDGVSWLVQESASAYVFTTADLRTYVEVRVPGSTARTEATAPLVDLAGPVGDAVPAR